MNPQSYRELVVELAQTDAQALSDILLELGALSVTLEDAHADTLDEKPLFGEPGYEPTQGAWQLSRLSVLIAESDEAGLLLSAAACQLGLASLPPFQVREVPQQDWVQLTQAQFEPIPIGQRIWVVPSWHTLPSSAPKDALLLALDPGLAFGTGSHPTTRLCMEWLEATVTAGHTVLDYGCGSGILAILAKKCGAAHVVGVDIDPQAIAAARRNSEQNQADVLYHLPDEAQATQFDLVIANILANPLKQMAARLCANLRPGGQLALSGILEHQVDELIPYYARWLKLSVWRAAEGWVCLTGQRLPADHL